MASLKATLVSELNIFTKATIHQFLPIKLYIIYYCQLSYKLFIKNSNLITLLALYSARFNTRNNIF